MDRFEYRQGVLWCEDTPAENLANEFGAPLYVYSRNTFEGHFQRLQAAFAELNPLICYSIKCCPNTHICRLLHETGGGFDVVSGGELHRALRAGADPADIVYAGVGKTETEIVEALDAGVGLFNIESESELTQLCALVASRGCSVDAALRINPDIDPHTHEYTATGRKETKFGVDLERAADVFRRHDSSAGVNLRGVHIHLGSPIYETETYVRGITRVLELVDALRAEGRSIDVFDVGGGFGAHYHGSEAPTAAEYADAIVPLLGGRGFRTILEPGRSIAANAGVLLTRVLHIKESGARRFAVVDASMNELVRPALYGAYHFVWPVDAANHPPASRSTDQTGDDLTPYDIVGPVCESGDFLAKGRALPPLKRGDLLAVFAAGAYAMAMASQYNSRPRAAEVLVDGSEVRLIRRRETYSDLLLAEGPL